MGEIKQTHEIGVLKSKSKIKEKSTGTIFLYLGEGRFDRHLIREENNTSNEFTIPFEKLNAEYETIE